MSSLIERDGVQLPRDYGDVRGEYNALRDAGLIDLANYGVLRVDGRDRAAWLHKLVTANVQALQAGQSAYALLLNAKAHVVADFSLLVQPEFLLLYTSLRAKEKLFTNLRRAIFREQVSLADMSDALAILSLQGDRAENLLAGFDDAILRVRYSRAGNVGFDLIVPRELKRSIWEALMARGARPVGFDALNIARTEAGVAWYGDDFNEEILAPEARLDSFIAENKGCYTGQEVIARIKNLGHVNRLLTRFLIEGDSVPQRGEAVFFDEKNVGWITSAVRSIQYNAPLAIGYLRREIQENDLRVYIAHRENLLNAKVQVL